MKNGLVILNVILLVAVAILFYLHFSSGKTKGTKTTAKTDSTTVAAPGPFRIGYFEMDSVESNFSMVKDVKAELNKKEDAINNELARIDKGIQEKANEYQKKLQSGAMTPEQVQAAQSDMASRQREFDVQKQQYDQEYKDVYMRRMQDVRNKIEEFLKDFNKDKKYSYILSYEPGLIYYRDSAYDITAEVVKGLNRMYSKTK
jgi:outer membrane protein